MSVAALLEALLAAPDDPTIRPVLADALLEAGDPRGDLLLAQARGDVERVRALLATHFDAWSHGLAPDECVFREGFVDDVFVAKAQLGDVWPAIARAAPVTRAQFSELEASDLRAVLEGPGVERLRELDLSRCALGGDGARALAACERLSGLRRLRLCGSLVSPAGASALASSTALRSLEFLDLSLNPLLASGVAALANRHGLPALKALRVFHVGAPTPALDATFPPPRGPGLLCVELPPQRVADGLTLNEVRLLEPGRSLAAGIDRGTADLWVPSILGGRRNSFYELRDDGSVTLSHAGHSLPLRLNGQWWHGREHGLEHGDVVEMPYRGSLVDPAPQRGSRSSGTHRVGLGLVFVR